MTSKRYASVAAFVLTLLLTLSVVSVSAQETGGGQAEGTQTEDAAAEGAAGESPIDLEDPANIEAGQALFVGQLGCYGCHGREGGGGMGPSLADNTWIYGGDPASIHESVGWFLTKNSGRSPRLCGRSRRRSNVFSAFWLPLS
jgi:mono/diheme cytochrome c family protein